MRNVLTALLLLLSLHAYAQQLSYAPEYEVRGNGKPVQLTLAVHSFKEVDIKPFPATIVMDAEAKEPSVTVSIDENLQPFLRITDKGGKLSIYFQHPQGKPIWVSSNLIKITIKTPVLAGIHYQNNSDLLVKNLHGESLALVNLGNGRVTLQGKVETLTLTNSGNGTVKAEELATKKATVVSGANGTIRLNARDMSAINTGFGTITNVASKTPEKSR